MTIQNSTTFKKIYKKRVFSICILVFHSVKPLISQQNVLQCSKTNIQMNKIIPDVHVFIINSFLKFLMIHMKMYEFCINMHEINYCDEKEYISKLKASKKSLHNNNLCILVIHCIRFFEKK